LSEALTQRLPVWERTNQGDPAPPSTMPAEFLEIARHCLRRDPQLRWSIADIAARMPGSAAAPAKQSDAAPKPQNSFVIPQYAVPLVAGGVALLVVLAGAVLLSHRTKVKEPSAAVTEQPANPSEPETKSSKPEAATAPPTPASVTPPKPVAKPVQPANNKMTAQSVPAGPAPPALANHADTEVASPAGFARGAVLHQVLPDAPQRARDTIQGKVRVSVKVHVDESGNVTAAALDSPGPSKYFADRVLQAAQQWKFRPAQMNGRNVPSDWTLRFEIDSAAINIYPTEVAPAAASH
jgi:TonB family protein